MDNSHDWTNPDWLMKRQKEYDKRMSAYGAHNLEPTSIEMFATHKEVVMEIDLLPYDQGGRK